MARITQSPHQRQPRATLFKNWWQRACPARLAQGRPPNLPAPYLSMQEMAMTTMKSAPWCDESERARERVDHAAAVPLIVQALSIEPDFAEVLSNPGMTTVMDGAVLPNERDEGCVQNKVEQCLPPAGQAGHDANITTLQAEAHKAIQDGEIGKADEILADVEKFQTGALERQALDVAQTTALRGEIALAKSHYLEAARYFAAAAAKLLTGQEHTRWKYLNAEANALYRQGNEFGDIDASLAAIGRYRYLAGLPPQNSFPYDWAMAQMNLGVALQTLGERESGTACLEDAITAYREALRENTRESVPLLWAMNQMSLGTALFRLGERKSSTARLEEAIAAYREALQEYRCERAPLDWARTQMNLGVALETLGKWESGTARLTESVSVYREALQENTRAHAPALWAMTQMSLGNALFRLGEREIGTARLEEAVAAYREALEEQTRARAAPMGRDPDLSWQCAPNARRPGERSRAPQGGRFCLSRSHAGIDPRAGTTRMGHDRDVSWQCTPSTRRPGERDGAARGCCFRLSRSLAGIYPGARTAPLGHGPDETRLGLLCFI
ncbi:MAG: tetratricopeptide repeat protein [Methylocella sp.]